MITHGDEARSACPGNQPARHRRQTSGRVEACRGTSSSSRRGSLGEHPDHDSRTPRAGSLDLAAQYHGYHQWLAAIPELCSKPVTAIEAASSRRRPSLRQRLTVALKAGPSGTGTGAERQALPTTRQEAHMPGSSRWRIPATGDPNTTEWRVSGPVSQHWRRGHHQLRVLAHSGSIDQHTDATGAHRGLLGRRRLRGSLKRSDHQLPGARWRN